jgi:beta-glucosidase
MSATLPDATPDVRPALPPGFRLGAATAAFQIEGGAAERGASIWDAFCRVPGAVSGGDTGDVACDHYHRWEADLDLMASLGLETYRFSLSWPRLQPGGSGPLDPRGVGFYRRLVEGLLARGIEPIATLYHWDLPVELHQAGGWPARDTAERFAEYARLTAGALGDVVAGWITHNEPWVVAFLGHAIGTKAPGERDWARAVRASHHVLLGHGLGLEALRATLPAGTPAGITLNILPVAAASDRPEDEAAAERMDGHLNRWFLDAVLRGSYPEDVLELYAGAGAPLDVVRDGDLAQISAPIDFLGVNYYNPLRIADAPDRAPLRLRQTDPVPPLTAMGWEVDPDGLHRVLTRIARDYPAPPIFVTENGAAYEDATPNGGPVEDPERTAYLAGHLGALARAIADGVDVRRYHAWSLLDNFEWEHGYAKRFGIVHVDYASLRRVPKRSALWYRDFIAATRPERE